VRSRLLLALSSKKASELVSVDGKKKLIQEIIASLNQPFTPNGKPQQVTDVFFTSFVIQQQ
jgi:flagellar FliL protein